MNELTIMTEMQQMPDEGAWRDWIEAEVTDFSILLGVIYAENNTSTIEKGKTYYLCREDDKVRLSGPHEPDCYDRIWGIRPALMFSSNSIIPTNGGSGAPKRANDGFLEVEYGYYPQKAASKEMQQRLERTFQAGGLLKTGKKYTTDSRNRDDRSKEFSPIQHEEFQLDGKRYVRVEMNSFNGIAKLSNGESYRDGDPVWVEVQPVKWLINEKQKIMLTDKIILSGIEFNKDKNTPFNETTIKRFLDTYLSKELEQSKEIVKTDEPGQRMTMRGTSEEQNTSKKQTPKTIEEENKTAKIRNIEGLVKRIKEVDSRIIEEREKQKKIIHDTFNK